MVRRTDHGHGVVDSAFGLLEWLAVLQPVRLIDLASVSGVPRPTVHRLLAQLTAVGAVAREGARYRLGPVLVALGGRGVKGGLRDSARRPLAELAASTGAGVALTAPLGADVVVLDVIDPREAPGLSRMEFGSLVPAGTAMASVHGLGSGPADRPPAFAVEHGDFRPGMSCATGLVPLPGGGRAAVSVLVLGDRMPPLLLAELRRTTTLISHRMTRTPRVNNNEE